MPRTVPRILFSSITHYRMPHQVWRRALPLLALLLIAALPAWAAQQEGSSDLAWGDMTMGLLGGLALFLFGMEQLGDGLKAAAGNSMKTILAKFTKNRVLAAVTGAGVTAVIQSSSITTVLVVGFVSAGVMSFTQSIGVIMGANVGTTVTAQVVAFRIDELALAFIALGFLLLFVGRSDRTRHLGAIVMGLGLVFFGMGIMSDAMHPLRSFPPFMELMASLESPLPAIVIAALFTALVQSSSATTGIVIVMAGSGLITLETGIAMALGANIGTCVTAGLAAIGRPVEAQRAALVHILFNVIGVLLWIAFIAQLAELSRSLSPVSENLEGIARLAADTPRQVANANTIFNLINTAVLLGFAGVIGQLAIRLLPDRPAEEKVIIRPAFLDEELLETPTLALQSARFEIGRLGELLHEMLDRFRDTFLAGRTEGLGEVRSMDDKVDLLFDAIVAYLGRTRHHELSEDESRTLHDLLLAGNNMEAIGDAVAERLTGLAETWLAEGRTASETTQHILSALFQSAYNAVLGATQAVRDGDETAALAVIAAKPEFERLVADAQAVQAERIALDEPEHLETIRLEMELIHSLRQVFVLSRRIAKSQVPPAVLLDAA